MSTLGTQGNHIQTPITHYIQKEMVWNLLFIPTNNNIVATAKQVVWPWLCMLFCFPTYGCALASQCNVSVPSWPFVARHRENKTIWFQTMEEQSPQKVVMWFTEPVQSQGPHIGQESSTFCLTGRGMRCDSKTSQAGSSGTANASLDIEEMWSRTFSCQVKRRSIFTRHSSSEASWLCNLLSSFWQVLTWLRNLLISGNRWPSSDSYISMPSYICSIWCE